MPKVCEFYLRGQCRYGVKCWNSHEVGPSTRQAVSDAETKSYNGHFTRKFIMIDAFLENSDEEPEGTERILEPVQIYELNERSFERPNTSITPLQIYSHCARPAQSTSTTSTNALIAQEHSGRLAQSTSTSTTITNALIAQENSGRLAQSTSTSTTITNALIAQENSGRLAQSTSTSTTITNALIAQENSGRLAQNTSTSTTTTNALIAQENSGRLAQSTSTSTTITNALITQLRVQDNCAGPSQSTSTNSTHSVIAQIQGEIQSQIEASISKFRPIFKQPKIVENKLSVAMKKGNDDSEKETASNSHALNQKKIEGSTDNHKYTVWDDILLSAIDSDLLCNICFEIFIKPTVLSCSHTFCESCILAWTSRVVACPICRKEVRSKSYCLSLESFIEKIVEHLPKEIKDKREVAIKDRINMKVETPQRATNRFSRSGISGMYPQQRFDAAISPPQYLHPMNRNVDFDTDVIYDESEIVRMNLHDTVVSTRGVNPLMSYVVDPEEHTSNRRITRPYNPSTRH